MQGLNNGLSVLEVANEIRAARHDKQLADFQIRVKQGVNNQQGFRREIEYRKDLESMLHEDYKRLSV